MYSSNHGHASRPTSGAMYALCGNVGIPLVRVGVFGVSWRVVWSLLAAVVSLVGVGVFGVSWRVVVVCTAVDRIGVLVGRFCGVAGARFGIDHALSSDSRASDHAYIGRAQSSTVR